MSNILSYQMTLRSEFRAAMSATISAYKRLYLQLFVGELMSYICYLILFRHSGVQHILWCVLFYLSSSWVLCTQCCQFLWIGHS
jgi:hypothetical protein